MAVVVSLGQVQSLGTPNWRPGVVRTSIGLYDQFNYDYATLYRTQPNVRTCVDFLARNIAQLGLHVFRRVSDTDRERLRDHGLARLLNQPLPPEFKVTRYRLIESLVSDLGIYFNAYWLKIRQDGKLRALLRIPPIYMHVQGGLVPTEYEMVIGGKRYRFGPEEVVHFRGYNPENPISGLSPLETLRRVLAEEHAAGLYREEFWQNSARMAGFVKRPLDAPEWSEAARARFIEEFNQLYSGFGSGGSTAVLEDGMEWQEASFSAQESEYLAGRKLTREECARAYHIPLPMVGILDHATFCLPAHVPVFTEEGPRPIADIKPCDRVWSHDGSGFVLKRVLRSGQTGVDRILRIKTQNRTLEANPTHPILVRRLVRVPGIPAAGANAKTRAGRRRRYIARHEYVPAGEIKRGDVLVVFKELTRADQYSVTLSNPEANRLIGLHGPRSGPPAGCEYSRVVSIENLPAEPVYDIEVEDTHNFIAAGVVVHNSNIREQHKHLYQDSLGPWLSMIEQDIELQLLPEFEDSANVYVEFNISAKLAGSFEEQTEALRAAVGRPWMTANEARARLNLPQIDGGDELVTPLNVLVGGQASPQDSGEKARTGCRIKAAAPAELREEHERKWAEVLSRHYRRQEAAIMSRVPKGRKVDIGGVRWDEARWVNELAADLLWLNNGTAMAWAALVVSQTGVPVSEERMQAWISEHSRIQAENINSKIREHLEEALRQPDPLEAVKNVFNLALTVWAVQQAVTAVTSAGNFGAWEAAKAGGLRKKTWIVTSSNPRPSHAALNGVSIGIQERFANGLRWPGDPAGSADENANCKCEVEFSE